jgi:NAD(P)-dependent dehydrogenase (short-subunit alcohol dehydrogenase family)
MAGELNGQVAIITGGGRGFGKAIALRFAAEGAAVTVTSRTQAELDQVVKEIQAAGGRGLAVAADTTKRQDVARVVEAGEKAFGPCTLLVPNAGVPGPFAPTWVVDPDEWWAAQEVHIRAPFLFIRAVLPGMIARRAGRIIIVSAKGSHLLGHSMSAYCVGKNAQNRLAQLVADETKEYGISVFAIDPGFVVTQLAVDTMNDPGAQQWRPQMIERLKKRREEPDSDADLARCAQRCVDLASGRYDGLSGQYMELPDNLDEMLRKARAATV